MYIESKLSFLAVLIAVVFANGLPTSIECDASVSCGEVVNGQYIVKLVEDKLLNRNMNVAFLTEELLEPFASRAQVMQTYTHAIPGFAVQGLSPIDVARLKNDPRVQYIEPVSVMKLAHSTNVPWNLDRIDQISRELDGVYECVYFGSGVNVYILDTGIKADHTDFFMIKACGCGVINKSRVTNGYNAYPSDGWDDVVGHGTAIAAVVGGYDYGVAKNATLVNVKVFRNDGWGTAATIIAGINFVIEEKKKYPLQPMVILLPFNGPLNNALNDAVTAAFNNGIFVVGAAGNDGKDACQYSPGAAYGVVTVGASQIGDYINIFSNTGECVDIYAPGLDIKTASNQCNDCSFYGSGTSYSAAHVSGVAALFLQQYTQDTPLQLWERISKNSIQGNLKDLNPLSMFSNILRVLLDTVSNWTPFRMKPSKRKVLLQTRK